MTSVMSISTVKSQHAASNNTQHMASPNAILTPTSALNDLNSPSIITTTAITSTNNMPPPSSYLELHRDQSLNLLSAPQMFGGRGVSFGDFGNSTFLSDLHSPSPNNIFGNANASPNSGKPFNAGHRLSHSVTDMLFTNGLNPSSPSTLMAATLQSTTPNAATTNTNSNTMPRPSVLQPLVSPQSAGTTNNYYLHESTTPVDKDIQRKLAMNVTEEKENHQQQQPQPSHPIINTTGHHHLYNNNSHNQQQHNPQYLHPRSMTSGTDNDSESQTSRSVTESYSANDLHSLMSNENRSLHAGTEQLLEDDLEIDFNVDLDLSARGNQQNFQPQHYMPEMHPQQQQYAPAHAQTVPNSPRSYQYNHMPQHPQQSSHQQWQPQQSHPIPMPPMHYQHANGSRTPSHNHSSHQSRSYQPQPLQQHPPQTMPHPNMPHNRQQMTPNTARGLFQSEPLPQQPQHMQQRPPQQPYMPHHQQTVSPPQQQHPPKHFQPPMPNLHINGIMSAPVSPRGGYPTTNLTAGTFPGLIQSHLAHTHGSDNLASMDDDQLVIGRYTRAERRRKIMKFQEKKQRRTWHKKILYACRKTFADKRPRVGGRFVRMCTLEDGSRVPIDSPEAIAYLTLHPEKAPKPPKPKQPKVIVEVLSPPINATAPKMPMH